MVSAQNTLVIFISFLISCIQPSESIQFTILNHSDSLNHDKSSIQNRYPCPIGFERTIADSFSYGYFLRNIKLFPDTHQVKLFDGRIKSNQVYSSVLQIDVGNRDLQQCADAVMRLRAEYLFQQKQYAEISFRFLGDGKMHSFVNYAKGRRDYATFKKYMNYVFAFANTASLKQQLTPRRITQVEIGDVFIQSGNPYGHAVCVVDLCQDSLGNKLALLAQSYMPAQEIHILKNFKTTSKENISWFPMSEGILETPEWTFYSSDLRHF